MRRIAQTLATLAAFAAPQMAFADLLPGFPMPRLDGAPAPLPSGPFPQLDGTWQVHPFIDRMPFPVLPHGPAEPPLPHTVDFHGDWLVVAVFDAHGRQVGIDKDGVRTRPIRVARNGRFSTRLSCNTVTGHLSQTGDRVEVSPGSGATTLMGCVGDDLTLENAVLEAIYDAERFTLSDRQWALRDASGQVRLVLTRQ